VLAAETMAGPFGTRNGNDLLVLKLNNVGDVIWQKAYGDILPNDSPVIMQQSSDKGYIVSSVHYPGFSIIKIDSEGSIAWQKVYEYDEEIGRVGGLRSILETSDGGFVALSHVYPGPTNMLLLNTGILIITGDSLRDPLK